MKKREAYQISFNKDITRFFFESHGDKGIIQKVVEFTPIEKVKWNLAFGDKKGDSFDDEIISNNNDVSKVIQTIVNIIHLFSEKYPAISIYIEGVDKKRHQLYHNIIARYLVEIKVEFNVYGINFEDDIEALFDPQKNYDGFLIERKKVILEK